MAFPQIYSRTHVREKSGQTQIASSRPGGRPFDRCLVIAHRGASYDYPENTMLAFNNAVEMGADMIEMDISLSRDGVPVIFHDDFLDAKTDGSGAVNECDLDSLLKLDAGSWLSPAFSGARIPTLEQVLRWASGRIALNLEIKSSALRMADGTDSRVVEKVLNLVRTCGMESHVLMSSFDYESISRVKEIDGDTPAGILYNRSLGKIKNPLDLIDQTGADAFHCHWRELTGKWLRQFHERGLPVLVYTVNGRWLMKRLVRRGVTGIFTDRPDRLRKIVDASRGS